MTEIDVLNKIRAEIEQGYCEVYDYYDQGRNYGLYIATQIIDKYIKENENKRMNVSYDEFLKINITETMRAIHEQGIEDEVFELLTQWMIRDRNDKMKKISEGEVTIRAINKIATRNKNLEQAIDGIVYLSESEE